MTELKTKRTSASVAGFLDAIEDDQIRKDCKTIAGIMRGATGARPEMWGSSLVGFGKYHYTYASGREGDWMEVAFAPRAKNITLYIMSGFAEHAELLKRLGKHSTGKGCLYIKRLSDVHVPTLTKLVNASVKHVRARQKSTA